MKYMIWEKPFHGFRVKYLGPTNHKGSRVAIRPLNPAEGRGIILERDPAMSPMEQALDYLAHKGKVILGTMQARDHEIIIAR